jgi:tetratricopeptide (TPR) repeat protein
MDSLLAELELQATRTRRRLWTVAVLAMMGAIAAVGGIVWKKRIAIQLNLQSIAILSLKNLGDASDETTIDGLSNGLTATVAQLTNATVIPYDSAARHKTSTKSLQEIGRELRVDAVVSGSAKRSGSRIQIDTQLTSVATGRQLWTKIFESEYGQLPMLQADIVAGLLVEVDSRRITPEQEERLARLRSVKPEVYEACLKGWLLEKRGDVPNLRKSMAYFRQAIREDPNYAPAYVGLANGYFHHGPELTNREASRLATETLMKALSLDPKLGEAHAALSAVKLDDWDWRTALKEAKRAIELSPNDALAHARYALALTRTHRPDEGLVEAKRAQRLDPLSVYAQQALWRWSLETRQYDRGVEELRKAIELEPNRSMLHGFLSVTYHAAGKYQEALVASQKAYELSGSSTDRAQIAHILVHLGKTDEAEEILEEIKDGAKNTAGSLNIAFTYATLKRKEETLKWLEYAYEARVNALVSMNWSQNEFAWLRSDPRFQDLLKRVDPPAYSGDADQ